MPDSGSLGYLVRPCFNLHSDVPCIHLPFACRSGTSEVLRARADSPSRRAGLLLKARNTEEHSEGDPRVTLEVTVRSREGLSQA